MLFKNRDLLKDLDVSQRDENSSNGKKGEHYISKYCLVIMSQQKQKCNCLETRY
jgi:hypothetical protein